MHSTIIHELPPNHDDWTISLYPRKFRGFRGYRHGFHSNKIRKNFSLSDSALNVFNDDRFDLNFFGHNEAINLAAQALSGFNHNYRVIAALEGGFRYSFSVNGKSMSTYIKVSQHAVIVEVGSRYVICLIIDKNFPLEGGLFDFDFTNTPTGNTSGNISYFTVGSNDRLKAIKEIADFTNGAKAISIIDPYLLGNLTGRIDINDRFLKYAKKKVKSSDVLARLETLNGRSYWSFEKLIKYLSNRVNLTDKDQFHLKAIVDELFTPSSYVSDLKKAISNNSAKELKIFFSKRHSDDKAIREEILSMFSGKVSFYDLDQYDDLFVHDRVWVVDSKEAIVVGNSFGGLGMGAISFILKLPREDLHRLQVIFSEAGLKI